MTTLDKADNIKSMDLKMIATGNLILEKWDKIVAKVFETSRGNEFGWFGIAKEDSQVIENLYPKVVEFVSKNNLKLEA